MYENKTFICQVTNYKIDVLVNADSSYALINTIECDYKNINALLLLIRLMIDELKSTEIKFIKQFVSFEEWSAYLKENTKWQIDINGLESLLIKCNIDDFIYSYVRGLGIDL